uniref:Putative secreted protein n=1 Tax=Anopheles darlingi TaxID=43151 RepID=A0A2M4DMP9_ANODA
MIVVAAARIRFRFSAMGVCFSSFVRGDMGAVVCVGYKPCANHLTIRSIKRDLTGPDIGSPGRFFLSANRKQSEG